MRATRRKPLVESVAAILGVTVAGPLLAQQPAESEALEEVIVTAQFREQNLQETPLAITAITGDMLEARSQTSI